MKQVYQQFSTYQNTDTIPEKQTYFLLQRSTEGKVIPNEGACPIPPTLPCNLPTISVQKLTNERKKTNHGFASGSSKKNDNSIALDAQLLDQLLDVLTPNEEADFKK